MRRSEISRRTWFYLFVTGTVLVSVALFLHPMSPEDFLNMAFSDPLQSVTDAQGANMAIFFWINSALTVFGLCGLLASSRLLHFLFSSSKLGMRAIGN